MEERKEEAKTGEEDEEKGDGRTKMQVGDFDELVMQGDDNGLRMGLAASLGVIPGVDRQGESRIHPLLVVDSAQ